MKNLFLIAATALALQGCAAGPAYMHSTSQDLTVNSAEGAICTGTREGAQVFSAKAGQTVTVTKSRNPILVECSSGSKRAAVTLASSADELSMSPLWDYASGSFNKYPAAVFVDLDQ